MSAPSVVQKIGAYARLLRLSNGPTAVADVWMGYAVTTGGLAPNWPLALMTLASLCFYHGGMVLNDAVDVDRDRRDDRNRPIPSGLIGLRAAYALAIILFLSAIGSSLLSIRWTGNAGGFAAVCMLLLLAPAYDVTPRASPVSPVIMGLCRGLNVMLGIGAVSVIHNPPDENSGVRAAFGIFLYVVGLTWYARDEARSPARRQLVSGMMTSSAGILYVALALWSGAPAHKPNLLFWVVTWTVVGLIATRGMVAGILQPTPKNIGRGVGIAIQGLVVIDATLATLYAGPMAGLAILALLPVTMLLARWIPQT